jgi:hypothetical protein
MFYAVSLNSEELHEDKEEEKLENDYHKKKISKDDLDLIPSS